MGRSVLFFVEKWVGVGFFLEKLVGVGRFCQKMGGSGLFFLKNGREWFKIRGVLCPRTEETLPLRKAKEAKVAVSREKGRDR